MPVPSGLNQFSVPSAREMFGFGAGKRIEDPAMGVVGPLVLPLVVVRNPGLQVLQHGVLRLLRRVLVGFPGPPLVVLHARLQARVEEDQLRAMAGGGFDKLAVAAFDDPAPVQVEERGQRPRDGFRIAPYRHLVRLPDNRVEVEMGQAMRHRQLPGEGALAGAGVAENEDSHRSSMPG